MKVTGIVESLVFDERSGQLRLRSLENNFWVSDLVKPQTKGLKVGDLVTVTANPGRSYDFVTSIEKGEAAPHEDEKQTRSTTLQPPVEQPPKPSEDFSIPYSLSRIGELYPVLVDPEGNVVDGLHRLAAKKDWRKEVIPWVRSRKDFLVARIHANLHRRTVPKEERQKDFTELANILVNEGEAKGRLATKISELTGFSQMYVEQLLPRSLKLKTKPKGTAGRFSSTKSQPAEVTSAQGVTQPETLPDAKVDVEKESERIGQVFTSAPDQDISDIYTGSCPACGAKIRWDEERKVFVKSAD